MERAGWIIVGGLLAACAAAVCSVTLYAVTGTFPTMLYRFAPRAGQVQRADFDEVAEQLAATQERFGVGLSRMPTEHVPCLTIVEDSGLTNQRQIPAFFRAPKAGRVTEAFCQTMGGTSATMDLSVDDGSPAIAATLACSPAGTTTPLAVPLAATDRLLAQIQQPIGFPTGLALCLTFAPGV